MKNTIGKMAHFQCMANKDTFLEIFGESMGSHLWHKFHDVYDYNLLKLWCALDLSNRMILINALESKEGII